MKKGYIIFVILAVIVIALIVWAHKSPEPTKIDTKVKDTVPFYPCNDKKCA